MSTKTSNLDFDLDNMNYLLEHDNHETRVELKAPTTSCSPAVRGDPSGRRELAYQRLKAICRS